MGDATSHIACRIPLMGDSFLELAPVNVIVGHYGVGKTNLALNLALDAARENCEVTLIDLDIVNPYFRSTEYRDVLEQAHVSLVSPVFSEAGGSLDVPSLTGAISPCIQQAYLSAVSQDKPRTVIIDAGGDDAGSTVLGRFACAIGTGEHRVFYVTNPFRNLTQTPEQARDVLCEIEQASGLKATSLIDNAHLKDQTDIDTIARGVDFSRKLANMLGLPFTCATVPKSLVCAKKDELTIFGNNVNLYPVTVYVKTAWE